MEEIIQACMAFMICISIVILISLLVKFVSFVANTLFGETPRQQFTVSPPHYVYESIKPKRVFALDTEMVGAGERGSISMVARVSVVGENGFVYDKYVKPKLPVTDYRTPFSGILPEDLRYAESYLIVKQEVASILRDCIVVGHDLKYDLDALNLTHPSEDIRDTALYKPLKEMYFRKYFEPCGKSYLERERTAMWSNMSHYDAFEVTLRQVRANSELKEIGVNMKEKMMREKQSLKNLAKFILGREIQAGAHSSVEDARAALDLYLEVADEWENN